MATGTWHNAFSVIGGAISNGSTVSFNLGVAATNEFKAGILLCSRKNQNRFFVVAFDYWSDGYSVIAGEVPANVTISKSSASSTISLTNSLGYTFSYQWIS